MSDSQYAAQAEIDFRNKYTETEGWKIMTIFPEEHGSISTSVKHLPEFLEKVRPEWRLSASSMISGSLILNSHNDEAVRRPVCEWDVTIKPQCWNGEVKVRVEDQVIVYHCLPLRAHHGWSHFSMIAYKDQAVLIRLHNEIIRWHYSRMENRDFIKVVLSHGGTTKLRRPSLTWNDIILPGSLAEDIRVNVDSFFKSGPRYKELGLPHKRGFLLAGPPGNGKTLIARIISADRSRNFLWVSINNETDDDTIAAAFHYAADHAPSILLFEDLDRMISCHKISMAYLLNKLDGLDSEDGILVLATSNAPEKLDPALLHRPSRFDRVWNIGLPGLSERAEMLKRKGTRFFSPESLESVAEACSGFSMAYTQEIITNAVLIAANAGIEPNEEHLRKSLKQLKKQFKVTAARDGLNRHVQQVPEVGFSAIAPD